MSGSATAPTKERPARPPVDFTIRSSPSSSSLVQNRPPGSSSGPNTVPVTPDQVEASYDLPRHAVDVDIPPDCPPPAYEAGPSIPLGALPARPSPVARRLASSQSSHTLTSIRPGQDSAYAHVVDTPPHPTIQPQAVYRATLTSLDKLYGTDPQWIDCPWCRQRTLTRTSKEGSGMQVLTGAVCCMFCVCLTCLPCIAGWFSNMAYYCSSCNVVVAERHHDGSIRIFSPKDDPPAQAHRPQYP